MHRGCRLRFVLRCAPLCSGMGLQELEPVPASPNGSTMLVTINQVEQTPGGSQKVTQTESYKFKTATENETPDTKEKRMGVKRNARRRAMDKFDPEKQAAKKKKRKKSPRAAVAADAVQVAPAVAAAVHVPPLAMPMDALGQAPEPDPVTARDRAILREWKLHSDAAAVLNALRERELFDDDDEPWSVPRLVERHEFLCRSVRVAARLMGEAPSIREMCSLRNMCM